MKKETLESKILPKLLLIIFKFQYFRFSLARVPTVKLTSGLFEMFPLGFRICIIQFFQNSTLNCRQTSAMTTDLFVLNNKIQYNWKSKISSRIMYYLIDVQGKPANKQPIGFWPELFRRGSSSEELVPLKYDCHCYSRSQNFSSFSGHIFFSYSRIIDLAGTRSESRKAMLDSCTVWTHTWDFVERE